MALTAADIDRWDPEAVREVFHASTHRAGVTATVSHELSALSVFDTWDGQTADAARHAVATSRRDLDAHSREALAVARAADRAADGIERVKADLATLRAAAEAHGLEVDPDSNRIVPIPGSTHNRRDMQRAMAGLQTSLNAIVTEADAVDNQLAAAINMADGDAPIPPLSGPPVGEQGLTPTQIAGDANQERLLFERIATRNEIDRTHLQERYDALAAKVYMGDHSPETTAELADVQAQLEPLKRHLAELDAVDAALGKDPESYLTVFDPRGGTGRPVLAAIAVGNPDTASRIALTVPGVGTTVKSLPDMVIEAGLLRATTLRQMVRLGNHGDAVAIAWMGYETPPNPLETADAGDVWRVMKDDRADVGAADLAAYLTNLHAGSPNAQITLLGHSYGSLTSSLALQNLHQQGVHAVDNVVFYGSPGLEMTNPDQLGLGRDHAFVMQATGDPITTFVAPLSFEHGWGQNPYLGMLPELSSQAGVSPDGVQRFGVGNHSDYARPGPDGATLRMSGYNFAAVTAGAPVGQLVRVDP